MSAHVPQVVDSGEFIGLLDYDFAGNNETVQRKLRFLEAYRTEGTIYHASHLAGINRVTFYRWCENDEVFAQAFADCHEDTYDQLETSGFKKALAGDSLLTMFYLKAHRPKFRDRLQVNIDELREQVRERMLASRPSQTLQIPSESDSKQKD